MSSKKYSFHWVSPRLIKCYFKQQITSTIATTIFVSKLISLSFSIVKLCKLCTHAFHSDISIFNDKATIDMKQQKHGP